MVVFLVWKLEVVLIGLVFIMFFVDVFCINLSDDVFFFEFVEILISLDNLVCILDVEYIGRCFLKGVVLFIVMLWLWELVIFVWMCFRLEEILLLELDDKLEES